MSITNTTKENLKDEHVCYAHLLSFLWWCLLCSSFKFSLEVLVMLISLAFFGGVCYVHLLSFQHNKHHQRKLKR
jgi:hypothetical protein